MAEGILIHICDDAYIVESAGTQPSFVRPEAVTVLAEIGIDISANRSKSVDEFGGRTVHYVLTVCNNAKEACPYFPSAAGTFHRSFPDPASVTGDEATRIKAFREVRDRIYEYLRDEFLPLIRAN